MSLRVYLHQVEEAMSKKIIQEEVFRDSTIDKRELVCKRQTAVRGKEIAFCVLQGDQECKR